MPVVSHSQNGKMRHQRMQVERAMRLMAVQKDGHRGNGDVGQASVANT
jgi:hypothetical protein